MRPFNPAFRRFGLLRFRSPLLTESLLISFPRLLRWFTSPGVALPHYLIHARSAALADCGFPHSDVRGSLDVCSSPRLFAACRVLLLPASPWHPPRALFRLAILPLPRLRLLRLWVSVQASSASIPFASPLPGGLLQLVIVSFLPLSLSNSVAVQLCAFSALKGRKED